MSILISYDEAGYKACTYSLGNAVPVLQDAVDKFINLSIGEINQEEFGRLFSDTVGLVFDKITGGSLKIGELTIKKEKAIELLDLPKGYSSFLAAVKNGIDFLAEKRTPGNDAIPANDINKWYLIDEKYQVDLNYEMMEKHKKCFQRFLNNDAGKKMYEFGKAVLEKYKELGINSISRKDMPMKEIIGEIITHTPITGHSLRVDGLLNIDRNGTV